MESKNNAQIDAGYPLLDSNQLLESKNHKVNFSERASHISGSPPNMSQSMPDEKCHLIGSNRNNDHEY